MNEKGAQRAIRTDAVKTLGFPYSISPEFLRRNQHQTLERVARYAADDPVRSRPDDGQECGRLCLDGLWKSIRRCVEHRRSAACLRSDCRMRSDGRSRWRIPLVWPPPIRSKKCLRPRIGQFADLEIGAHLHARPAEAAERIRAAFQAGCRRFDAAIGGLGGCPFAQDVLVGNIPTEVLMAELRRCGANAAGIRISGRVDRRRTMRFRAGLDRLCNEGSRIRLEGANLSYKTILVTDEPSDSDCHAESP